MEFDRQIRWMRLLPALSVVLGLPLALKLIPPNGFYGVRIPATMASPASWYRANFWAGVVSIALGLLALAINFTVDRSALGPSSKFYVILATTMAVTLSMAAAGVFAA